MQPTSPLPLLDLELPVADRQGVSVVVSEPGSLSFPIGRHPQGVLIALVNVPYGTGGESMRPLGLAALGAYLLARGIGTHGYDFSDSRSSPEQLVEKFELARYPTVGLSFYNTNAKLAFRMAKAIKAINPNCLVIGGGPHVSAASERLFTDHPEIDVIVRNEGEVALFELLKALDHGRPVNSIPGITCHRHGRAHVAPARDRIDDLDSLPPPVYDFIREEGEEKKLYFFDRWSKQVKPAVALVTSRSCPFRCSFCAIILIGRKWRKASSAKIIGDLTALEKHRNDYFSHVYFLDANFFVDAKRVIDIALALQKHRPGITFSFSTRVNQLIRWKAFLPDLASIGLRAVELGIESGSDAVLKRFAKDTTTQQNTEAIRLLSENGIQLFLDFVMFDAEASLQDLALNLRFLEANSLDSYVPWDHIFSHMTPYLGTAIRRNYEDFLGHQFEEDELPDPAELIRDGLVRAVFREINELKPIIPRLARALWTLESRLVDTWTKEQARLRLNAASLRRYPYVVLRNLVGQASKGHQISYEQARAHFLDDDGHKHHLEEFLTYALL